MFKSFQNTEDKKLNHSGRSLLGETVQLDGDLRSSGAVDISSEMVITETGSVRGTIEAGSIEISGHVEGKVKADTVIVGKSAVIKGDIFFKNTLKTEEGADIDGYIKRTNNGKQNSEEDIAIEEIVERGEFKKPKVVRVSTQKEAV